MVTNVQSIFVMVAIVVMMAIVSWVLVANLGQFDVSKVLALKVLQPAEEEPVGAQSDVQPDDQISIPEESIGQPVNVIERYPVVHIERGAGTVFAP